MKVVVEEEKEVLLYLLDNLKYKRKVAKSILTNQKVKVNGKVVTKYNTMLHRNQNLEINENKYSDVEILYEDAYLLAVNKPANMLTVATEKENDTLYHLVSEYVKKENKTNKIFIVHRLDRETSGILLFAKSEKVKQLLQEHWDTLMIERGYEAIVVGKTKTSGTVVSYLTENKAHQVYVSKNGKVSITHYRKKKESLTRTLLEITIETGRKHQIRIAMQTLGHPILGDMKYGHTKANRMYLHASKLIFTHPITKKKITILSPSYFHV